MSSSVIEKTDVSKVVGEVAITVEELYRKNVSMLSGIEGMDKYFTCTIGAL